MDDYRKITDGYQGIADGKGETLAAAAIAQAEMFGWIFAKFVKNGWATEDEIENFLKDLRYRNEHNMQASIYDLVLNRLFEIEKKGV